jgi:hypothetical protein
MTVFWQRRTPARALQIDESAEPASTPSTGGQDVLRAMLRPPLKKPRYATVPGGGPAPSVIRTRSNRTRARVADQSSIRMFYSRSHKM